MSEEFKCPYCEGTASIAYHRTGNNLLYCHDCEKTFSEVGAKIMKQAARIAELEKMAEARKLANCLLEQERNELEAERDRLRKALKEIAKFADSEYEKRIPAPEMYEALADIAENCGNRGCSETCTEAGCKICKILKKARGEA
ncbi:hypothetical protein [uncultured Victivallis sp.]|uniref:hypothetical protein n=1 Tax=uncultured Victivallis sp. TaxID=354118 RepID=UPI002599D9B2|nr:hypothetical protein [uncultured Victivallis sp.]